MIVWSNRELIVRRGQCLYRRRHYTAIAGLIATALGAEAAYADPITIKPVADVRLQLETLDVDTQPETSEVLTLRARPGIELSRGEWTARIDGQANIVISGGYADGLNSLTDRPIIPDPESVALYQAYLRYKRPGLAATIGRQEISLDDERFVGTAPIRQNAQNFDALRLQWTGVKGLSVDMSYAWSFRTIWGDDGFGARPAAFDGDNLFVNVAAKTPLGTLTTFGHLIDLDQPEAQSSRLTSKTFGLRLTGTKDVSTATVVSYLASFARQSDAGRNPNNYTADFIALEAEARRRLWRLGGGFEVLGADEGVTMAAFQTPFSSGVKFLGLAGRFLPTPPDGVRDFYTMATLTPGSVGVMGDVRFKAVLHHFTSDRDVRSYGDEIDLLASGKLGPILLAARYADYRASGYGADTKRFMLQLEWRY